ncbi:MAG: hypothetical protein ACUVXA_12075 [Candidatus Jordarchaeum sp.]|uniref:hypothetical protein n=1 Tax=Candidatus Jordarchaeum sp. TaxID=2823881 RepID=UPI00404B861B
MVEYISWLLPLFDLPRVVAIISIVLILYIILGRFAFKILKIDKFLMSNTAINIPIYGATGFVVSLLFLNIIGAFTVGIPSLVFFLILTASALFILVKSGDATPTLNRIKNIVAVSTFRGINNINWSFLLKGLVPLFLIILTFFHFSLVISQMGWPPVGDILSGHGPFTSLLLYNGKIITTLEPLASNPLHYPIGFHVVAANIASWFHLFPGEAVFLLGGLTIILIPLLMYSLTYMLTKSIPLSLLVYFSVFMIHPSGHLEKWIVGFFYNGPYPNLTAFMIVIFSICILGLTEYRPLEKLKQRYHIGSIATLFFSLLALLLVYPSFSIFVAIMITFVVLRHRNEFVIFLQKKPISTITPFLLVGGLTFLTLPRAWVYTPERMASGLYQPNFTYIYGLVKFGGEAFLFDHITGYVMCIALFISLILIYKKKYLFINLIYIIIFCWAIFTLSPAAPTILFIIEPSRAITIPCVISWLILSLGITEIFRMKRLKKYLHSPINSVLIVILISFIILIPQFSASIVQEFSYANAQRYSWYTSTSTFPNDFIALLWINYNIPPNELILNDLSWTSYWIPSLSIKNITYNRQLDPLGIDRAKELKTVWEKPHEEYTVYQLLKKYDVHYVFLPSFWGWYDAPELGGTGRVVGKPFSAEWYVQIFDTYPFLKIVFRLGSTTVYKVDLTQVPEHRGLNFNGLDNYVDVGNSSSLSISDHVTLEAWIKITSPKKWDIRTFIGQPSPYRNYIFVTHSDGAGKWCLCLSNEWEGSGYKTTY